VVAGLPLVHVYPEGRVDRDGAKRIRRLFVQRSKRSEHQDVTFLFQELAEMASRALSPGINDPFTAIACLDWMTAGLARAAQGSLPSMYRYDPDGNLRVLAHPPAFEELAAAAYDQIRQYGSDAAEIQLRLLQSIATVAALTTRESQRRVLADHAARVREAGRQSLSDQSDIERLDTEHARVMRVLREPNSGERLAARVSSSLPRVPNH
jgi:uncharacterized membrane protein